MYQDGPTIGHVSERGSSTLQTGQLLASPVNQSMNRLHYVLYDPSRFFRGTTRSAAEMMMW